MSKFEQLVFPALMFLIGNKSDLEWSIPKTTIEDFAAAHDFDSALVMSAKTGKCFQLAKQLNNGIGNGAVADCLS